jgi:autophagy-related protein 9
MQSVTWQFVILRLMDLRDHNVSTADRDALSSNTRRYLKGQSKQRMDAHDIANRLMRKENYWIAIINRDILDCSVNLPFLGRRQFYTRTMEWNLGIAISAFVFDKSGHIKPEFLVSKNRAHLVNLLKKRFRQIAIYNCFVCIIGVLGFVLARFLSYFTVSLSGNRYPLCDLTFCIGISEEPNESDHTRVDPSSILEASRIQRTGPLLYAP